MNGQWEDQNRMMRVAGPVLLTALGVLMLVVTAVVFFVGPPALAVTAVLLVAGVIALLAGVAWGMNARPSGARDRAR